MRTLTHLPHKVRLVEVGPRDGLQNEAMIVPMERRAALIERLADAGLTSIEVGAFVSPKWVPQMGGSAALLQRLGARPGVAYSVLVPNLKGFEAAREAGAREIAVFGAASETFSRKNINCSIEDSMERFRPVVAAGRLHGMRVRGYVSCVLGCPYEGEVPASRVAQVALSMLEMGCDEISLGDTIGVGTPGAARALVQLVARHVPHERIAVHFHDTYGQALANIFACLEVGIEVVDSAVAGLGGCPYARGASGNVATEDVVYMLHGLGIETGVSLQKVIAAGSFVSHLLNRPTGSKVAKATQPD